MPYFGGSGASYINSGGTSIVNRTDAGRSGSFQGIGASGGSVYTLCNTRNSNAVNVSVLVGGGGAGYGAGGGGGYGYCNSGYYGGGNSVDKAGGGAGQLKQNSFAVGKDLTGSIAVTVGAGAAATSISTQSSNANAYNTLTPGAGTRGCVAIFW